MKIDRLMGILLILSRKGKVTAPYLAEHFEVSKRTINRDIETLCMAGVPIITRQGSNGGILIQEGYNFDKAILSKEELTKIITGLNALNSIDSSSDTSNILDKLYSGNSGINDIIDIELGSFYTESVSRKIRMVQEAVKKSYKIQFIYYSRRGKSNKIVDPYKVVYKWQNWYLYAFSDKVNEFRWYKLNRLWDLQITKDNFILKEINKDITEKMDDIFLCNYVLKASFDKSVEYILVENYENESYIEQDDGRLYFERDFTNFDFMLSWVLSFGDKVIVYEPECLIEKIKEITDFNRNQYI
ncbi:transcriptional regulator [Vallitalea longa]|uniref:Transcriptional regulator n=1 Tax=Vallitalea longa TaxID=2936439 RepID=A0A9W5YDP2_9FIRM|nr:YafY family protein [Vallitalea longa]GKX32047.1 transcriptional regulator [Vallitalea longa]